MNHYTGFQYLLIDCANAFGLDKLLFEQRIEWATSNLDRLEDIVDQADVKPLFIKATQAIRKAQNHLPTGHLVAMDAVCSGMQIMSAITGCVSGATATGMVDPERRADAYTETTGVMAGILGEAVEVPRADVKQSVMTVLYGSKAEPKAIFGADTPALAAFYEAMQIIAPGACELLQHLLDSWQSFALNHEWQLPDGFNAKVKVMAMNECRIEVDELDHASMTYQYYTNEGSEKGLSNVANVIHSIDGFILREMTRRCNHHNSTTVGVDKLLELELLARSLGEVLELTTNEDVQYYVDLYEASGMASVVILPHLNAQTVSQLSDAHLRALKALTNTMQAYTPFPLVTIHDSFAAHANNVNWVRHWYKEILAELADSVILDHVLSQIHGMSGHFAKLSNNLSEKIRASNYALS
jgi:hypothetical protein